MMEPQGYEKPTVLKEKPESESPADCITFYLERDILGKLANMHLRLCDQYG